MPLYNANSLNTQNDLLMENLMEFYKKPENMEQFISIVNGSTQISLRIIDWFVTNYAKKYFTIYEIPTFADINQSTRFKVYNDYKLKLKAYSKRRFDPFCRWERIQLPCNISTNTTSSLADTTMETTIGQLNFFKWAIEHRILDHIRENYFDIETDMNLRNTTSKHRNTSETSTDSVQTVTSIDGESIESDSKKHSKTRKKREELSISACKCIKKETVKILVKFYA